MRNPGIVALKQSETQTCDKIIGFCDRFLITRPYYFIE
ncbi:hypothetical protein RintRC_2163 [Richelia intracellularis]|nr:hypothetical protein RintRC_2163 [Richelia intracellularis]